MKQNLVGHGILCRVFSFEARETKITAIALFSLYYQFIWNHEENLEFVTGFMSRKIEEIQSLYY